jgi:hypothetical protein
MAVPMPQDLVEMIAERRVIPFLGAGFSASHDLPGWDELLRTLADDLRISETTPALTYEQLQDYSDGDFLRIAEYLYLRAGRTIGPLRYFMTNALHSSVDPLISTPHVELVNLGCPQVYTTNFDEVIETTYHRLKQPVEVVALSRDVAVADSTKTQIVKYHGDLRHDQTLVVTESQYWKRLDFESPMDLKFRSDLLGRAVMFIGYSFRDINIRVIWFKLMQMMRDVPVADRLPSYMVRFEPNPVLEALYEEVGLKTIALDPNGAATTAEERTALLSEFLYTLANEASDSGLIPGTDSRMFASDGLFSRVESETSGPPSLFRLNPATAALLRREVDDSRVPRAITLLEKLLDDSVRTGSMGVDPVASRLALWALRWAPADIVSRAVIRGIAAFGRQEVLDAVSNWSDIWAQKLPLSDAEEILAFALRELDAHETLRYVDWDLAYSFDLLARIADGSLSDDTTDDLAAQAKEIIGRIVALYPVADGYSPPSDGPPAVATLLQAIEQRAAEKGESDTPDD